MTAPDTITILSPRPPSISVQGDDGSELLRIAPDGTVTAADLILAQEAGRIFVDAVRRHMKPMADLVAEVEALNEKNRRLTQALLLSTERHIANATGHDDDVIDYARRVIVGEEPQP